MSDEHRSEETAPEQELVWPPPDSELDSYTFPLLETDSFPRLETGEEPAPDPVDVPQAATAPLETGVTPAEPVITPPEPLAAPPELVATPLELVAAPPELVATPVELVAMPPEPEVSATAPTPVPLPLPLSYVLHSNVEFGWHEAIAIVRQLADQLTHGLSLEPQGSLPDVDGIELEPTGRLLARLDPGGTVPLVRGLGFLLHILLADTEAPARLRLIVSQAVSEVPTFPSVERLTWELAGFERPLRLETLKQLYERVAVARRTRLLTPVGLEPDFHAASPPVSSITVGHATAEAAEPLIRRPQLSWPALTLALVGGAVGGALVFAAITARSATREPVPTPRAFDESTPRAVAESTPRTVPESTPRTVAESTPRALDESTAGALKRGLPDASRTRTGVIQAGPVRPAAHTDISGDKSGDISPSPGRGGPRNDEAVHPPMKSAVSAHEIVPLPVVEPVRFGTAGAPRSSLREVSARAQDASQRAQREYRRARALFDQKDYAKAAEGFQQVVKLLDEGELAAPTAELRSMASDYAALSRATLSAITEGHIYSSGDEGVTEPVALRQYLPDPAPGTPASRLGALMLVVDSQGVVESVRLQSPSNRYHDRFWVSVAKTWRFKPALKDGQPVKFLKRIAITEPPLSDPQ